MSGRYLGKPSAPARGTREARTGSSRGRWGSPPPAPPPSSPGPGAEAVNPPRAAAHSGRSAAQPIPTPGRRSPATGEDRGAGLALNSSRPNRGSGPEVLPKPCCTGGASRQTFFSQSGCPRSSLAGSRRPTLRGTIRERWACSEGAAVLQPYEACTRADKWQGFRTVPAPDPRLGWPNVLQCPAQVI